MIKVWHNTSSSTIKAMVFNKIELSMKEAAASKLQESMPMAGPKDVATTMMSKKIGKNLYISPDGRKYRRAIPDGQKASKTAKSRTKH